MAITSSAKKALRGSKRKKVFNTRRKNAMKEAIKTAEKAVSFGDKKEFPAKLSLAYKAIDKAVKRGVIKENTAARKKSRLAKLLS
jgi:small subunit ribosomal protein S20